MKNSNLKTIDYCTTALCAAVIAILAQITIPMPVGIPITLQTFGIAITAILLGKKRGTSAVLIYLLLGGIGIPVFHNFTGGIQSFWGPTGGFLLSFPALSWIIGYGTEKYSSSKTSFFFCLLTGTAFTLLCGMLFFSMLTGTSLMSAFTTCVLPFLPTTILQMVLAAVVGLRLRKRLIFIL